MKTAKRWAPLLLVVLIFAPVAVAGMPDYAAASLLAWGVLKVGAFGALGILLDRFAAPYARPHELAQQSAAAVDLHRNGSRCDPAVVAQAMRSADAANLRRAVCVLGCQLAGALL